MKKVLQFLCVLLMIVFLARGYLYRYYITYTQTGEREKVALSSQEMIDEIIKSTEDKELSIEDIIETARKKTNQKLRFTSGQASNNPNNALKSGKANCVGYAALFSSIADFMIKDQKATDKYQVRHVVGTLDYMGENLNEKFNHPFFRDHDFNEVTILATGEKIYIDPSVSDYLGIHTVNLKK